MNYLIFVYFALLIIIFWFPLKFRFVSASLVLSSMVIYYFHEIGYIYPLVLILSIITVFILLFGLLIEYRFLIFIGFLAFSVMQFISFLNVKYLLPLLTHVILFVFLFVLYRKLIYEET